MPNRKSEDENNINPIYTVGYATYPNIEDMFAVFRILGVNVVIDVRSIPHSRTFPQYEKDSLARCCKDHEIYYRHYKREFGARQMDMKFWTDGQVDFERFAESEQFKDGLEKMRNTCLKGYTPCLLCAERDPIICHRSILIGRNLKNNGLSVLHITKDGLQSQDRLEERLIELHFPNRDQMAMWDDPKSPEEMLEEAYRRQNYKIGYRNEKFD